MNGIGRPVLTRSVAKCAKKRVEGGIEIVTDGEFSKPGFFTCIRERTGCRDRNCEQRLADENTFGCCYAKRN